MAGFQLKAAVVRSGEKRIQQLYQRNFQICPIELQELFSGKTQEFEDAGLQEIKETDVIMGRLPATLFTEAQEAFYEKFLTELIERYRPRAFVFSFAKKLEKIIQRGLLETLRSQYRIEQKLLDSRKCTGAPVQDARIYLVGLRLDMEEFRFTDQTYGPDRKLQSFLQKESELRQENVPGEKREGQDPSGLYLYKKGNYVPADFAAFSYRYRPLVSVEGRTRMLSNRELARLKGFPDGFFLDNNWSEWIHRRICDSVHVQTAYQVFAQLYRTLMGQTAPVPCRIPVNKREYQKPARIETEENTTEQLPQEKKKRIFLSYCHNESELADLIEERLLKYIRNDFYISRDVRDVGYRESFRSFMQSVREHEFVIMLISDSYLKSINCMYEMTEVFQDHAYEKKLLFIVLQDTDAQYCGNPPKNRIGAQIYDLKKMEEYLLYWQKKEKEERESIDKIADPVLTGMYVEELKKIQTFKLKLEDFFGYLRDSRGLPLSEHFQSEFAEIRQILYKG